MTGQVLLPLGAETAALALLLLHLELLQPPNATRQSKKFNILISQACDYTDFQWSESEE
jgi:hypothetical protein